MLGSDNNDLSVPTIRRTTLIVEPAASMRFLQPFRGHNNVVSQSAVTDDVTADEKHDPKVSQDFSGSDSDTLSLEARNEKEIQTHPDQVTRDAELGVQKAEAAALVWSKPAVYATYAWYDLTHHVGKIAAMLIH